MANVNWRFKWLWLYAFVHPQTGETYWWIIPSVTFRNTEQQESQTIHQEKKVEIDSWHELNRENRAIKKD